MENTDIVKKIHETSHFDNIDPITCLKKIRYIQKGFFFLIININIVTQKKKFSSIKKIKNKKIKKAFSFNGLV